MSKREQLQTLLETTLGSGNVYFQPPENVTMEYPCILYARDFVDGRHADDKPYSMTVRYIITLIDKNPDSPIIDKLLALPTCSFIRHYKASGLNHDLFNIYYK